MSFSDGKWSLPMGIPKNKLIIKQYDDFLFKK